MNRRLRLWNRIRNEWSGVSRTELWQFGRSYAQRNGYTSTLEALAAATFGHLTITN